MKFITSFKLCLALGGVLLGANFTVTIAQTCPGSAGCLDETFGVGGRATASVNFGTGGGDAEAVAIQPSDGKIVVAAQAQNYPSGTGWDFYVLRFSTDGSLDESFGVGGISRVGFTAAADNELPWAVAVDWDGKILVAGQAGGASIARLNPDGSLDPTFGTNGKLTFNFVAHDASLLWSLAIQPNGYIVAAGTSNQNTFAFARLRPNGTFDTSFNGSGKLIVSVGGGGACGVRKLALQTDGKIVGVGMHGGSRLTFGVMRVNTNGTLDSTFGTGGQATLDFGGSWSMANAVGIDTSGKIVVGGNNLGTSQDYFAFARYLSNGNLDTSFGSGGKFVRGSAGINRIGGLVSQADGKIAAAGRHHDANLPEDFAILRLTTSGALDPTFGSGGTVYSDFSGTDDRGEAMAMQPDGKFIVAGMTGGFRFGLISVARYLP